MQDGLRNFRSWRSPFRSQRLISQRSPCDFVARWGSSRRVLCLGSYFAQKGSFHKANDRFKMKIWILKCLNWKPSDGWNFSQRRDHFATKSHFPSQGPFSQPISQLWNGTRVPRGCFATVKIFTGGSYEAAKWFRSGGPFSQPTLDFIAGIL